MNFTVVAFSWGNVSSSVADLTVTGPGQIAASCAELPPTLTPASVPTWSQGAMLAVIAMVGWLGLAGLRRT